ncbi:L-threonine 3-dehydrogenase, putative [Bodo saltans]|uniref:L-threonine 3-dehydrogenase, mitochondrial n=1 Tax=Bodo saltans TaxID=75058 RepID=A0A0S4IXV3_BODSA|nr:L-threonine 3-dehydrogenase, putative [Bodo saltans]|eukprot:CUG05358.1 L-threonine 3-dehydrogenase, putative [Bodo saltans]
MRSFTQTSFLRSSAGALRFASAKKNPKILITGGLGQIGTDLSIILRKKYGAENVIVTDINKASDSVLQAGPFFHCNSLESGRLEQLVVDNNVDWILHLSAIMSVLGEKIPHQCMDLNIDGLRIALEVARKHNLRIFAPSTMAVFGADAGKVMTKDDTILNPTTIYGITKVLLEQLGAYYNRKWGVDFRSIRYPGIISAATLPGGGTTDYAVHMYHYALNNQTFNCPVHANEPLPMMYIDDAVNGTVKFLEADRSLLKRCTYNMAGFSFTPDELHKSIEKHTKLSMTYEEGTSVAQGIAHSWPDSMDDTNARNDWGWKPEFLLDDMTKVMFDEIPRCHPAVPKLQKK